MNEPDRSELFSVSLFGPCSFTLDAGPFAFLRRRSALPLFVFLALHRESPLPRDFVAFSLWPDETEDRARELLRRNLYLLAQALPGGRLAPWILTDNDAVWWNSQASWDLDVARFEMLCSRDDPAGLAQASALYRGDLCEGVYDEWIPAHRERFRMLYAGALDRLVRIHRGRGEPSLALEYAKRALIAEPWREDVVRRVIRLRFELGDRGGAIAEFDTFARRLRDELGAEPMAETYAARDAVLRGDPGARITSAARFRSSASPNASRENRVLPFVGREREMDALFGHWSRAARGSGSVVLVGGEGGIGKSRLLAEFALRVEAEGARVLSGASSTPERRPYEVLSAALADSWPLLPELPIGAGPLAALASYVLGFRRGAEARRARIDEPIRDSARLFEALGIAFEALACARPTLLVLDELQGAGEATLAAIARIAARTARAPLLVVGAFRSDTANSPTGRWRCDLSGSAAVSTLAPDRLRACDLARALADTCHASLDARVAGELIAACDGNPRDLIAFVRELDAGGDTRALGAAIRNRFRARLERCSADARTFAEMAAIAGNEFEVDVVARALGWDEARAHRALDEFLDLHLIEDASRARVAYRFAQAPVRSALELALPRDVRRSRHRRLAVVFDRLDCEGLDRSRDVARHAERGGDLLRAARAYETAAMRAAALFAFDDARALIARGLLCAQGDAALCDELTRTAASLDAASPLIEREPELSLSAHGSE